MIGGCLPSLDRFKIKADRCDILPKLQRLPVRLIAEAMGASPSHCSNVPSSKLVPHTRHWAALRLIARGALSLYKDSAPRLHCPGPND